MILPGEVHDRVQERQQIIHRRLSCTWPGGSAGPKA
jgi:hypothetical protein